MIADRTMKLIVIGESSVGKTNLILRYAHNQFMAQENATIGLSFVTKMVQLPGQTIKLQLWDTAGQERFRSIARSFYTNAQIGFVVFDLTSEASLRSCELWLTEFVKEAPDASAIIVGNKADLPRACDGKLVADKYGLKYYEVSALSGAGVEDMFKEAVATAAQKAKEAQPGGIVKPIAKKPEAKGGCC